MELNSKKTSDLKTSLYQTGAEGINILSAFISTTHTLLLLSYLKVTPHRMENFILSQSSEPLLAPFGTPAASTYFT